MKIIKLKTLNEAIEESISEETYSVIDHNLASAKKQEVESKEKAAKIIDDKIKEFPVDDRDAHTKIDATPAMKKMMLAESLFEEYVEEDLDFNTQNDLRSDVYNALVDIAFEYHKKGINLSVNDFELAWEWFATHFEDDDILDESINGNTSHAQDFVSALRSAGFGDGFDQKLKIDTYGNGGTRIEYKDQGGIFIVTITDDKVVLEGQDEGSEAFKKEFSTWEEFASEFEDLYPGIPVRENKILVEENDLKEASYTRSDNKKMLVKPNRDPLVDVIQLALTDGEWGYVKSPDGTVTPSLLPHLSYDIHDVGVSFDREGRYFVRVWDVSEEALQKVAEVAKQFNREYKIGLDKFVSGDKKWYCLIYLNEDTDFDDPYVDPEAEVNKEGIKGRGTKLRGNPEARHARDNEDLEDSQRYPIESPTPAQTGLMENNTTDILPPTLDKFLMDCAQMWCDFDYNDISKFAKRATKKELNILNQIRSDLKDGFDEDDPEVKGIFNEVEKIVKGTTLTEDISVNGSLMEDKISTDMIHDFKPQEGTAEETFNRILEAGKMETFEFMLEDRFPQGVTTEELNKILSDESQWVYDQLGMKEFIIPEENEEE